MPINPCTGAPGATPHWTCIAANPPGHASPPGTHGTGGKRSLPAGRPVRPVYQSDQIRTREGYRDGACRISHTLLTGIIMPMMIWMIGVAVMIMSGHVVADHGPADAGHDRADWATGGSAHIRAPDHSGKHAAFVRK